MKRIGIYFLLIVVLIIAATKTSSAQQSDSLDIYRPRIALKIAPWAFFTRVQSIRLALELRTFQHQAFEVEYSYIDKFFISDSANYDGFRLRTEYRFYFHKHQNLLIKNRFWGLQFMHQKLNTYANTLVWRSNFSYQELLPLRMSNVSNAFYLTGGQVFPLPGPLYIELAMGIGMKILEIKIHGIPPDGVFDGLLNRPFLSIVDGEGIYHLPSFYGSVKIIYPFR